MTGYTVDLTISCDSIEEQAISRQLGIEATRFFKKGEPRAPGAASLRAHSTWVLEVLPPLRKEWPSLEEGLNFIMDKLEPARDALHHIADKSDTAIVCGCFYSSLGAGSTLSPNVIRRLAELGLSIRIQNYWGGYPEEPVEKISPIATPGGQL